MGAETRAGTSGKRVVGCLFAGIAPVMVALTVGWFVLEQQACDLRMREQRREAARETARERWGTGAVADPRLAFALDATRCEGYEGQLEDHAGPLHDLVGRYARAPGGQVALRIRGRFLHFEPVSDVDGLPERYCVAARIGPPGARVYRTVVSWPGSDHGLPGTLLRIEQEGDELHLIDADAMSPEYEQDLGRFVRLPGAEAARGASAQD